MSEAIKNRHRIEEYIWRRKVLDIGCGDDKISPEAVTLDYACEDVSIKANALSIPMPDNSFDTVHASHILEDIEGTHDALREWFRVLKPGGHLIILCPHKSYYPNIGHPLVNKAHKHDFYPHEVAACIYALGHDIVKCETFAPPYGHYDYENRGKIEYHFLIIAVKS